MRSTGTTPKRLTAFGAMALAGGLMVASAGPAGAQEMTVATPVESTISGCLTIAIGTVTTGPGGSDATVNQVWKCQVEADDERLSGDLDLVFNILGWSGTGAIQWGWARITNDGGTWDGVWSSTVRTDGEQVILAWYEGGGAYEGWSYTESQQGDYQQERTGFGIVYPGELPPTVVITPPEEVDVNVAQ